MNAVIYARYSSDSQREESIEGQLRECGEYAERNGITVVGSYIDRALSAKTADRPEFQRMIKDSAKGLFEIVLVWKLDRFSRDRYDSAHYKHILKKNGVKVVSAKEHISDGPEGIILESMLEGYAEFYSAELSEKIHRGQKENALKGKNNGGGIPLGYLVDKQTQKLVVDPETAPLVVEIFERYSEGATVRSIIEDFNSRGLTTKRGKPFNTNSFNALLKNRKYIGEYSYQDVVIPGGVSAIVPEDLFYRVQQRMEKNKRAPAHTKAKESEFLLTTKLFCGKCERMMVGESGKSHTGAMHYYYKCGNAKRKKGCNKKAVKKDWIERAVVRLTMERVLNGEKINRIIDALLVMQEREDVTIPALCRQLAETEKGIDNMLNAIQQGIFTASTKQRLEELEKQKEELSLSITTAELKKPKLTREYMEHWFSQFRYGDPNDREFQKRLIDTFVNAIFVYDDKLVLTYNYQHGTQTITLKEVEDFLGSDLVGLSPPKKLGKPTKNTRFGNKTSVFSSLRRSTYQMPLLRTPIKGVLNFFGTPFFHAPKGCAGMEEQTFFDYYYGGESEQFAFYRIPRQLVTGSYFKNLSTDAKLLYGLLLDRMSLSMKNGWYDEQGRVYIYYPLDEIQEALCCSHGKAVRLFAELDTGKGIGLIERIRQGQGKPARIYVKQFTTRTVPPPPPAGPEPPFWERRRFLFFSGKTATSPYMTTWTCSWDISWR